MRAEVMEFYGLARSPRAVGYYETAYHRQLLQDIKQAVYDGDLVALCGVVGAGKTVTLRRLQEMLAHEGRVIVSKSVAVEKSRATLGTLITALFCDLSPDKEPRIPKQGELRERELRHLVRKRKKPIVLLVDEAHDLHHHTLTGLKRLIEMVADGGGKLSVLLAGHPKLRRDLRSPTMEEIGYRTVVFPLEGRHRQPARVHRVGDRHLRRREGQGRGGPRSRRRGSAGLSAAHPLADRAAPDARLGDGIPGEREASQRDDRGLRCCPSSSTISSRR